MRKSLLLGTTLLASIAATQVFGSAAGALTDKADPEFKVRPVLSFREHPAVGTGGVTYAKRGSAEEKELILYACPTIRKKFTSELNRMPISVGTCIRTSVGTFSAMLNIGSGTKERYDFFVILQEGVLSRLAEVGPCTKEAAADMVLPAYYSFQTEPSKGTAVELSTAMETILAEPLKSDEGKATKSTANTFQVGGSVGYPQAASLSAGFSSTVTTSFDIPNVMMFTHLGSETNPAAVGWEYQLHNPGHSTAHVSAFPIKHYWIWRVNHELAKLRIYDAAAKGKAPPPPPSSIDVAKLAAAAGAGAGAGAVSASGSSTTSRSSVSTSSTDLDHSLSFTTRFKLSYAHLEHRGPIREYFTGYEWKTKETKNHPTIFEQRFSIAAPPPAGDEEGATFRLYKDGEVKINWGS